MRRGASSGFATLVHERGTSLDEVADLAGLTMATMLRLAGGGTPGEDSAARLAEVLGVTAADVIDPAAWLAREHRRVSERQARLALALAVAPTGLPDWRDRAACRWADPEAFWPAIGGQPEAALALCATCPVLGDCREDHQASRLPDEGGIWWGTTANDRREYRQAAAEPRRGAA